MTTMTRILVGIDFKIYIEEKCHCFRMTLSKVDVPLECTMHDKHQKPWRREGRQDCDRGHREARSSPECQSDIYS
jgi:hypothetical protein